MGPDAILDSKSDPRTTGLYILYEERVPLVRCDPPFFLISKAKSDVDYKDRITRSR